jgi:hypothetical protein
MSNDVFGTLLVSLCSLTMFVALAGSLVWVYVDANAHGKTGCLWVLIAFFTWPLGVLAYALLRGRTVNL